eukprot:125591_1
MATDENHRMSRSPPGRLYFQVVPEAQRLKQLLCSGFVRHATRLFIPPEIVGICGIYYDEVQHWTIENEQLETANPELYTDIFVIDDIQMKCSIHPNKTDQDTVFSLHIFLPKGVERIVVYSELFCTENDAHFRYVVPYIKQLWNIFDDWHYYEYIMYLKCKEFESINLSYYVEILSISYNNGTASYFKPIKMKKKLRFKWDFDEAMVKKFRKADTRQMFLSETFDEYNNNWGLWIIPMDYVYDNSTDQKRVQLALTLYRRPPRIVQISVKYRLETDYCNIVNEGIVDFGENVTFEYLKHLFESEILNEINCFSVTMNLEVYSVNFETDFLPVFQDVFE